MGPRSPRRQGPADKDGDPLIDGYASSIFWILPVFDAIRGGLARVDPIDQETIDAYRRIVIAIGRAYRQDIRSSNFFDVPSDLASDRAFFSGVEHDEWPLTSEKGRLAWRIDSIFRKITSRSDLAALKRFVSTLEQEYLKELRRHFEANARCVPTLSKLRRAEVLRLVAISRWANLILDEDRVYPDVYSFDFWTREPTKVDLEVRGGPPRGYRAAASHVTGAVGKDLAIIPEVAREIREAETWDVIQGSARKIWDAVEARTRVRHGFDFDAVFEAKKRPSASCFAHLRAPAEHRHEPVDARIRRALYWYPHRVMNEGDALFAGADTFISLMRGEAASRKEVRIRDPLEVIRFQHDDEDHIPWFSYGVLVERSGNIADYSGWLIILRVGADYNGLGGSEYWKVERALQRALHEKEIVVRDVNVPLKALSEYVAASELESARAAGLDDIFEDGGADLIPIGRAIETLQTSVVVLGSHASMPLLEGIRAYLRMKGFGALLVKDVASPEAVAIWQKSRFLISAARFCIMLDDRPGGHQTEFFFAKDASVILAVLVPQRGYSSAMMKNIAGLEAPHIKDFRYDDSPLERLEEAIEWANERREIKRRALARDNE